MMRAEKEQFLKTMRADMERAAGLLFVDYTKLTVEEADRFRRKLGKENVGYKVVKNKLMARLVQETAYAGMAAKLKHTPTGVVLGYEDPVLAAKLVYEFLNECEHLQIKGGVVENQALSAAEVKALSELPSKAELLGRVMGAILSPAANLLAQVKGVSGRLVGAIEQKAKADEA